MIFHFFTLKSHFVNWRFLHYVLTSETEKKVKKKRKKGIFFLNSQNFTISFYALYTHFTFCRPNMSSQNRGENLQFYNFLYIFFHFLTLKHNVKNVNLEHVILRWESESVQVFVKFLTKKKVIFFVLRAKVEQNKKLEKSAFFINSP